MLKTMERRSTNNLFSSLFTKLSHNYRKLGKMLGWVLAELMIAHPTYSFQGEMFQLASPRHSPFSSLKHCWNIWFCPIKWERRCLSSSICWDTYTYFSSIFFLPPTYVGIRLWSFWNYSWIYRPPWYCCCFNNVASYLFVATILSPLLSCPFV